MFFVRCLFFTLLFSFEVSANTTYVLDFLNPDDSGISTGIGLHELTKGDTDPDGYFIDTFNFDPDSAADATVEIVFTTQDNGGGWDIDFSNLTVVEEDIRTLDNQTEQITLLAVVNGLSSINLNGQVIGSSGKGSYNVAFSVVPLPAAAWLFGSALVGLVSFSRRQKLS